MEETLARALDRVHGFHRRNRDAKPHLRAEAFESFNRAFAFGPETEVFAHHHMSEPKSIHDNGFGKLLRCQRGKSVVEWHLIEALNPQFFQPVRLGLGIHQAERGGIGVEIGARVRLECDDAKGGIALDVARQINHRLVAQMHPVKIADRGCGAAVLGGNEGGVSDNSHGLCVARGAVGRKRR